MFRSIFGWFFKCSVVPVAITFLAVSLAPPAEASLSTHFGAAIPGSTGSAAYSNGNLSGVMDFAVFTEAAFEAIYTSFDVPLGELAYVYEIENTGTDAVSASFVSPVHSSFTGIGNDATLGGVAPTSQTFAASVTAQWDFVGQGNNIGQNQFSTALVLTSPVQPGSLTGFRVVNGGGSALVQVVAPVPEPVSFIVWTGISASALVMSRRRRRS